MRFKLVLVLLLASITLVWGLSLEERLQELSADAAKAYVGPIVSGFGSNLNGGWFHRAPSKTFLGVDISLGAVVMGTFFTDENESFSTEGSFRFTREQAMFLTQDFADYDDIRQELIDAIISENFYVGIFGPTIIGDPDTNLMIHFYEKQFDDIINPDTGEPVTVPGTDVELPFGGLMDSPPIFPLVVPQLSVGTVYGTRATFRYVPPITLKGEDDDLGEFSYFGFGLQHNLNRWVPLPLPVDFAASFFTQTMKLEPVAEATATTLGLNASKRFGFRALNITPYAGLMIESFNMDISYDYMVDEPGSDEQIPLEVAFSMKGDNKARMVVGSSFRVGLFNLNVDYNIGKYNSLTTGIALEF